MNPTAENMPDSISAERPVAVGYASINGLMGSKSASTTTPKKSIIASHNEQVVDDPVLAGLDLTEEAESGPQTIAKPGREERKSVRVLVPQARRACQLKVGSSVLPALMVDRSASGFAVLIDCLDGLKAGKKVELNTDAGHFKVRIVYINKAARPKDAPTASDSYFRVGLKKARSFRLF
jgi:hypothetical protein